MNYKKINKNENRKIKFLLNKLSCLINHINWLKVVSEKISKPYKLPTKKSLLRDINITYQCPY